MNASSKDVVVRPEGDNPDEHAMPLMEHLMELRRRLIVSIAMLTGAFIVAAYFSKPLFDFLAAPLAPAMIKAGGKPHLIFTHLAEGFTTQMKLAFFTAAFVTFPIFANQLWKFIAPGLYKHEKRALLPFLFAAPVLFFAGGALAYYIILPAAGTFLLGFQQLGSDQLIQVEADPRVSEYLSLVLQLVFAFGLAFQMPVLLVLLARVGILSAKMLSEKRRYAIIGIFVFAAVVTPPDVVSQLSLAIPMMVLYEISVIGARMMEKKPEAQQAANDGSVPAEDTDFNAAD